MSFIFEGMEMFTASLTDLYLRGVISFCILCNGGDIFLYIMQFPF